MSEQETQSGDGDNKAGSEGSEKKPQENANAEFSRKIKNIQESNQVLTDQNAKISQQMDAVMQAITAQAVPKKVAPSSEEMDDLYYSDPDKWKQLNNQKLEDRILSKVDARDQQTSARQVMLTDMVSKYPELNNPNSELYKVAIKNYGELSNDAKSDVNSYKLSIMDAVTEVGVLPMNRRGKGDESDLDEFIGGGGDSGDPNRNKRERGGDEKLNSNTAEIARRMGIDPSDPKVATRLKEYSKRKWNKYR